jgi:hypothetical protein
VVEIEDGAATTATEVMVKGAEVTVMFAEPEMLVNPACVECAVQLPVPAPEGVNTPPAVIVPPVAVHVTPLLKAPVPETVAEQVDVCAVVMDDGTAATVTPVTVADGDETVMFDEPEMLVNPACVECAVQLPVPAPEGVNTPPAVIVPPVAVHVTPLLKAPVPETVAEQADVCAVVMDDGTAATVTPVTVADGDETVMLAEPEMFVNPACVECAVQLPVPVLEGVNTPPAVIVPPVAVHVTALLKAPVPATVAEQVEVCAVVMDDGTAATPIEVIVIAGGGAVTVILPVPDMLV